MKKLKTKIIRKELRTFCKENQLFLQLKSQNTQLVYPILPLLERHGLCLVGVEDDQKRVNLLYYSGGLKVIEL